MNPLLSPPAAPKPGQRTCLPDFAGSADRQVTRSVELHLFQPTSLASKMREKFGIGNDFLERLHALRRAFDVTYTGIA